MEVLAKTASLVLLLAIMSPLAHAQKLFFGKCPEQAVQPDFNVTGYLGDWYEAQKYFAIFQATTNCVKAEYTATSDPDLITVVNRGTDKLTNKEVEVKGEARVVDNAKLNVAFFGLPATDKAPGNYWVLDTDYENYSVVWSCTNYGLFNTQYLWLLFRSRVPTDAELTASRSIVTARGLDAEKLSTTNQNNCSN